MCDVGPMNHADPRKLSDMDKQFFVRYYRPEDYTLQDYVNWLWCANSYSTELPYEHIVNLRKIKRGERLILKPGILPPPASCNGDSTTCNLPQFSKFALNSFDNIIKPYDPYEC